MFVNPECIETVDHINLDKSRQKRRYTINCQKRTKLGKMVIFKWPSDRQSTDNMQTREWVQKTNRRCALIERKKKSKKGLCGVYFCLHLIIYDVFHKSVANPSDTACCAICKLLSVNILMFIFFSGGVATMHVQCGKFCNHIREIESFATEQQTIQPGK